MYEKRCYCKICLYHVRNDDDDDIDNIDNNNNNNNNNDDDDSGTFRSWGKMILALFDRPLSSNLILLISSSLSSLLSSLALALALALASASSFNGVILVLVSLLLLSLWSVRFDFRGVILSLSLSIVLSEQLCFSMKLSLIRSYRWWWLLW